MNLSSIQLTSDCLIIKYEGLYIDSNILCANLEGLQNKTLQSYCMLSVHNKCNLCILLDENIKLIGKIYKKIK